jgi:TonB-dependent starch-binding outer membrane protein SusC
MKKGIIFLIILTLSLPGNLFAQKTGKKYDITGQVVDANDKPVSGAVVLVDSKSTGVFTNEKGIYQVKVKANATKIAVIKLPNGQSEEEISGRTVINFKLDGGTPPQTMEEQQKPDDEVINIGYGSATKKQLTTNVRKIDGGKDNASYQSIYEMLQVDPSIHINGKKITIRGINSINSTDPLIIVNGIPVSSIDDVSPRNVKSIEVLKGSNASIYGPRGANGVVMITLNGSENK